MTRDGKIEKGKNSPSFFDEERLGMAD
jgi:hypothetical protein